MKPVLVKSNRTRTLFVDSKTLSQQYNTIQYNTIQYDTIQCNTIQYNTMQYNKIQNNTNTNIIIVALTP